jgi:hypothetical protein
MNPKHVRRLKVAARINLALAVVIAAYFFFLPGFTVVRDLADPALRTDATPRAARRLFRSLTPRYRRWAETRMAGTEATRLTADEIAATEWPLFGSVFYLWAVEDLQDDWERGDPRRRGPAAPRDTAREAVEAAIALVLDPAHATWVRNHWGEDYLHRENVFYRMLLIAAMTSHHRLTGDPEHLPFLRDQATSLAAELDASPHGLLDDYPGECYPGDVLMAIAAIRRADAVLGTDHRAFAARAVRGFEGPLLDQRGLLPYAAIARGGFAGDARGCGLSYAGMSAPYLWPERAITWFDGYERYFWQERHGLHGFREFANDGPGPEWHMDVDAGPVLGGIGVSASAFGLAAARIMGRFDRAWPLAAQTIVFSWPLPDGTLLMPRVLSNAAHAPHLGEACILYTLTRRTAPGMIRRTGGSLPPLAGVGIALYFILSAGCSCSPNWRAWRRRAQTADEAIRAPRAQWAAWLFFLATAAGVGLLYGPTLGVFALLPTLLFPVPSRF